MPHHSKSGPLLHKLGFTDANIIMVYILGVLLTSIATSHQLYSMVENLLDATWIEEERMTLRTAPELLSEIIEEAMAQIRIADNGNGIPDDKDRLKNKNLIILKKFRNKR